MRVLLDENIPHGVRGLPSDHEVFTVANLDWAGMKNGQLLKASTLMLSTADWNLLKVAGPKIAAALAASEPGSLTQVDCGTPGRHRTRSRKPTQ